MRLILLDSDESYLDSIRVVVSSQLKESIEVFTASNVQDFLTIKHLFSLESYLLIHEDFINQLHNHEELVNVCQKYNFGILTEGVTNIFVMKKLFCQYKLKLRDHVMKSQTQFYHGDTGKDYEDIVESDLKAMIVMKYQPLEKLLITVKDNFIVNGHVHLTLGSRSSHIISMYSPYGNLTFSNIIETTLKKFPKKYKILIIHYDPFLKSSNKTKFNLSYLFTMIKRGKTDLSLVINEIKVSLSNHVDMILGPGSMLDIDCLSVIEEQVYIQNLQSALHYDFIIFNLNGVHLTKHINEVLEKSKDCILCHEEEDVQLSVIRQTKVKWTMMMNNIETILSEVIVKHER